MKEKFVNKNSIPTRRRLITLAALLTLPFAKATSRVTAQPRRRTVTRTYRNAAVVTVPVTAPSSAPVSAYLYPSPILVSGLPRGRIRGVKVTLSGLSHYFPGDLEVLMVGPRGQTAVVMGNVGGVTPVTDVTLRLDDAAAVSLPPNPSPTDPPLASGSYRPANYSNGIIFNTPAPPAGMNAALSVFGGTDPNGTWCLFVQNQFSAARPIGFAGGWALELTVELSLRRRRQRPVRRRRRA
jgi:hypothetical protein